MKNLRLSFKNKVLLPVAAIFLVSVISVSLINYRLLDSSVKTKTDANLELFIDSVLTQIKHLDAILIMAKQTLNEKHLALARSIAHILDSTPYTMTPEELLQLAEPLDIIELNIADSNGIIIASSIPDFIGFDYNSLETTKIYMALANGTLSELSEEPRVSVADGETYGSINHYTGIARSGGRGFIQIGFNADVINRLHEEINIERTIREANILRNGFGMVLYHGIVIAHPDVNMPGRNVNGEEWYKAVSSGNGFAWVTIDNENYYAGFKNENGNTAAALVSEREYYRELNLVLIQTLIFVFLAIVIMIIVVYIVLGKLLSPIKYLVRALEKIAAGNLDMRIEGNYNDEFDKIKDAVNSMAQNIKARETIISGIEYASKIQRSLLPPESTFKEAFADYHCLWKPKDIVGGDIYWIKNFKSGTVLCVCDCTGHGTPGALLTMLVASAFDAVVTEANCHDTAGIIRELDKRLVKELNVDTSSRESLNINDGCELAVLFIAKDGTVTVSAGNTKVFICDGEKVLRLKGQRLRVGEGKLQSKEDIKAITIPYKPENKFYVPSDGLYEQVGGRDKIPFGYDIIEEIIIENHNEKQSIIVQKIWQAFENYRGDNAIRDDFELIAFTPKNNWRL